MARFYGYSSIDRNKKFRLEDYELIKRDLLNNLLIRQGTLPGRPNVGTDLWNYLFEVIDDKSLKQIETQMLAELTVSTVLSSEAQLLRLFLNTDNLSATYL